jgi:hypothetical protein
METVDKIRSVKTDSKQLKTHYGIRPMLNVPLEAVIIESIALKK